MRTRRLRVDFSDVEPFSVNAGKGEYKSTQQDQPRPTEGDKNSCIMKYKEVAGVYFAKSRFYPYKVNFVKSF